MSRPTLHQIPVCPFSQRLEILLALKGQPDAVEFGVVDITIERSPHILALTGGSTALPVLELPDGRALKESMVLMQYLEDTVPGPAVRRNTPWERAVEDLFVAAASPLVSAGYRLAMNPDRSRRQAHVDAYHRALATLDQLLERYSPSEGPWVFDRFGWCEAVFTPMFQRFWMLDYYEDVQVPDTAEFARVRRWHDAAVAHPAAQQVSLEQIIKLYYDYARNAGNGSLAEGRSASSLSFTPPWQDRPWPPKDKYGPGATDADLGLLSGSDASE